MHRHTRPHLAVFAPSSCFPFTSCFILRNYFPCVSPPCFSSMFPLCVSPPCFSSVHSLFIDLFRLVMVILLSLISNLHPHLSRLYLSKARSHLTNAPAQFTFSPVKTHSSSCQTRDFTCQNARLFICGFRIIHLRSPVRPVHLSNSRPLSVKLASRHLSNSSGPP
jgi:hypothetical protein